MAKRIVNKNVTCCKNSTVYFLDSSSLRNWNIGNFLRTLTSNRPLLVFVYVCNLNLTKKFADPNSELKYI